MRQCKQSDVQALEAVLSALEQFNIELTMVKSKLTNLSKDLNRYIKEQQEPINVQTTHGLSADNG
jgi:hypothetical protein